MNFEKHFVTLLNLRASTISPLFCGRMKAKFTIV